MYRRSNAIPVLVAAACTLSPAIVRAQEALADSPEAVVEAYVARLGIESVRAAALRARLDRAPAEQRPQLAAQLGAIYVDQLERATTAEDRLRIEALAQDLIRRHPSVDMGELRINLQRVQYAAGESIAERHRLRMASDDELREAERLLRRSMSVFREIAASAHRRVELLERRESRGESGDDLREALSEARRVRSLGMYYTGWSRYYLAFLTGDRAIAGEAIDAFGWVLNAPGGRGASLDRLPQGITRFEHVARAAVGVAMCESLRGQDVTALRWLDALAGGGEVPQVVKDGLLARRIAVLGDGGRWYDLRAVIERLPVRADGFRLSVAEARLLSVVAFEGIGESSVRDPVAIVGETLGQLALGELVRRGEVAHVLDLVQRFGESRVSGEGFVVRFVQGLQAYERARELFADGGEAESEPTGSAEVATRFRSAASSLRRALEAEDAELFPEQVAECRRMRGLSLYFAGELREAARVLTAAASDAGSPARREEAMWFAIVALDRAIRAGDRSAEAERDRLATLYLASFPSGERAARLLIGASGDQSDPERAVEVLLSIEAGSAVYESARRRASQLLYRMYRDRSGAARSFAAARFAAVGAEVFEMERRIALDPTHSEASVRAATSAVQIGRQLLDVLLGGDAPDVPGAEGVLVSLRDLARVTGADLRSIEGELAYRALQIALLRGDSNGVRERSRELGWIGGPFVSAGDRLVYNRAMRELSANPEDRDALAMLVDTGVRVADAMRASDAGLQDAATLGVHDRVAEAAAVLWRLEGDRATLEVALTLDRRAIDAGQATVRMLRRAGELREASGDHPGALEAWRVLLAGATPGESVWFEARYESLRLLAGLDPSRARAVLAQHRVLHPELGPQPWGGKIAELAERLDRGSNSVNNAQDPGDKQ